MKYEKNQYTEGLSVCAFIFAGILLYWSISGYLSLEYFWSTIALVIGLAIVIGQIAIMVNRGKLRNVVLQEFMANPNTSIETISQTTGITTKDIQAIILDLKASGLLRGTFSHTTGELEYRPAPESTVTYCPNCGTAIERENPIYCPYCGAKL